MSKFRVGDVCEIIDTSLVYRHLIGLECSIVDESFEPESDWIIEINGEPPPNGKRWGITSRCLRLKRPPGWDKWIGDTRHVRHESLDGVPA